MGRSGLVRTANDRKAPEEEPVLKRLLDSITGLEFQLLFDESYLRICERNPRSELLNLMTLFMMLALRQLCGLSDKELEYQVNVRRSNKEFSSWHDEEPSC